MSEKTMEILQQYDLDIIRTLRVRGAILCETRQGTHLLQECKVSESRLAFVQNVLNQLKEITDISLDRVVRNKEGNLMTADEEGTPYVVKEWSNGQECDLFSESQVLTGVRLLGRLHQGLRQVDGLGCKEAGDIRAEYKKHRMELKRARSFVKKVRHKSDFELELMKSFSPFYEQALEAEALLETLEEPGREASLCHGDFSHHHILLEGDHEMVTDFLNMERGRQVLDLYYFMRKTLEKQRFRPGLGEKMMKEYDRILPLTGEDQKYLYIRFLFPEKYWKQVNYYFNANKAWIPGKNTEKIRILAEQEEERQAFLTLLRSRF